MFERTLTPLLVFTCLAGGTFAVGSEWVRTVPTPTASRTAAAVVQLPRVEVTGRRAAAPLNVAGNEPAGSPRGRLQ